MSGTKNRIGSGSALNFSYWKEKRFAWIPLFSHHLECKSVQELFLLLMLHTLATCKSHAKWIYNMWSAKNRLHRERERDRTQIRKDERGGWRRLKDITSIEEKNQNFQNKSWRFFRPTSCLHACMHPWIFFTYWTWQQLWPQARPGVVAGCGAFDFHAMETFAQKQLHADHLEPRVVSCLPSRAAVITTVLSLSETLKERLPISSASLDLLLRPNLQISKSLASGFLPVIHKNCGLCVKEESRKQITEGLIRV